MATPKPSKRLHTDSDSDGETNSTFPHFNVLESLQEKQLSTLNPFVVEKVISGIVKTVSVKTLQNGTLLIEVNKKTYADNLLKIKAYPHLSLNSSKLSPCTLKEIKTYLKIKEFQTPNALQSKETRKQSIPTHIFLRLTHPIYLKDSKLVVASSRSARTSQIR